MIDFKNYKRVLNTLNKAKMFKLKEIDSLDNQHKIVTINIDQDKSTCPIHIHFYTKNAGQISYGSKKLSMRTIFPLKLRPLGKYWLPVPNDPETVLNMEFIDISNKCGLSGESCDKIKTRYSFVERVCHNHKVCIEKLELFSITIGEIEFHN